MGKKIYLINGVLGILIGLFLIVLFMIGLFKGYGYNPENLSIFIGALLICIFGIYEMNKFFKFNKT